MQIHFPENCKCALNRGNQYYKCKKVKHRLKALQSFPNASYFFDDAHGYEIFCLERINFLTG